MAQLVSPMRKVPQWTVHQPPRQAALLPRSLSITLQDRPQRQVLSRTNQAPELALPLDVKGAMEL